MILSQTCNYAIRAALYVATQKNRDFVPIREISQKLHISFHFITKILQRLTQNHIMISFRGPNGGVGFARPLENITLLDIIITIDGPDLFQKCLLGLDRCNDQNPCPLHEHWAIVRENLKTTLERATLAEVASKVKEEDFRLTNLIENTVLE